MPDPISVVIPACGGLDLTTKCLEHLAKYTPSSLLGQVLYVDNGSEPEVPLAVAGRAEELGLPFVAILNGKNLGFTKAVNQGLESSAGHVLILNNDCFVGPDCIRNMMHHIGAVEHVAAVGPLTGDDGGWSLREELRREQAGVIGEPSDLSDVEAVAARLFSCEARKERRLPFFCTLLHRDAIKEIGHLEEHPDYESGLGTDFAWCRKAHTAGWKLLLALDAYAYHLRGETFRRLGLDRAELAAVATRHYSETAP